MIYLKKNLNKPGFRNQFHAYVTESEALHLVSLGLAKIVDYKR